jgi:uracil-DNA glycosylase
VIEARIHPTYESWHEQARALLTADTPPGGVLWIPDGSPQPSLPGLGEPAPRESRARVMIPRRFVDLARLAARHRSPDRWALLYRVLWRVARENRRLLDLEVDDDVVRLQALARQVREDVERMKAFLRFRSIGAPGSERYVAWHRPDHDVAALAAPHFSGRYPDMPWSIVTPDASVHWDGRQLSFGQGVPADAIPMEDSQRAAEQLWRTYYAAAFNPARANPGKLSRDMPQRFRSTLPEAALIPALLAEASDRAEAMRQRTGGATSRAVVPATPDMDALRAAAAVCRACPLHAAATQTVFGEGPAPAPLVLVGEQPGDAEDRHGRPFVGPAGEVLDRALVAAGIARPDVYVTNAVKHFAWEPRGKRRIHRTPRLSEIQACRPWVEAELASVAPRVLVCLGATAARTLLGPQARVGALRGRVLTGHAWAPAVVVTLHPSAVLRSADPAAEAQAFAWLVQDLTLARDALQARSA